MPARPKQTYWRFTYRKHKVQVLLDKVLFFRYIRRLHGRFWGLAAILGMSLGFIICFAIRPELLHIATPFSDFGRDVRTAPYFAASVFFAAYGMWRWRNYLSRTWKRTMPVTGLITLTILGLYLVALMPVSWHPWPYRLHFFGVALVGVSMLATVVLDGLLSTTRKTAARHKWELLRLLSVVCIVAGGWITFGSAEIINWYQLSLLGEILMLLGYGLWISVKTYQGEGKRTLLSRFLKDFVLVD